MAQRCPSRFVLSGGGAGGPLWLAIRPSWRLCSGSANGSGHRACVLESHGEHHIPAGVFFVAGLYVAVQEALETTVSADIVKAESLSVALGTVGTVNGLSKFVSSTAVGIMWTLVSPTFSFGIAALVMLSGAITLASVRLES